LDQKKITLHVISPENDLLRVTTFGAQALAESTIKTYEEFQINRAYLKSKTSEILGLLRRAAAGGYSSGDTRFLDQMKELGGDLYRELIPASLRAKLDEAAGGGLCLSIEGNMVNIPWELLYDGIGFFCRRYHLGRIVSIPPSARKAQKKQISNPVTFLSVSDPEGNLPGAFREGLGVRDLVLDLDVSAVPVFLAKHVKVSDLLEGLRRCDVLHFAGHVEGEGKETSLCLADGRCSAARIEQFAGRHPFPLLVMLNGCSSSRSSSKSFSLEEGHARAFDLASSFLLSGARHFVGTLWDVRDVVAAQAGVAFFRGLLSGMSVGAALWNVREELAGTFGEPSMLWAGYLLYGDPGVTIGIGSRMADRFIKEMGQAESRIETYLQALGSTEARERFVAACALHQLGRSEGRSVLDQDFQVLIDLLESPSLLNRRQGILILQVLDIPDGGYRADGDPEARAAAIEVIGRR